MWSASAGIFSARWSDEVLTEWTRNLLFNRPDLKPERLVRTIAEMNRAIPDAIVTNYETFIPTLNLPDADDRHVLAAAITSSCDIILTLNLKDFPTEQLPEGMVAMAPDRFLSQLFDHNSASLLQVMKEHRASLTRPPKTAEEYIETLKNGELLQLAQRVTAHLDQI